MRPEHVFGAAVVVGAGLYMSHTLPVSPTGATVVRLIAGVVGLAILASALIR